MQQGISESSRMSDLRDKSGYTDTDFPDLERKSSDPGSGSDGVTSAVEVLAGFMVKRIWKNTLWHYESHTIFSGRKNRFSVFHAPYGSDDDNDLSDSAGDLYGGKSGAGNFAEGAVPDRNGYDRTGSVLTVLYAARKGISRKSLGRLNRKREESAGKLDLSECMGKTE